MPHLLIAGTTGNGFFFQAEDGIRYGHVTGVQTCALPILSTFSYYLGLIFQVQDDILDVTGDANKIGKPVGSDSSNEKSTYPKLLGMDGAIKQKQIYVDKAKQALQRADADKSYLILLTDYLTQRDH